MEPRRAFVRDRVVQARLRRTGRGRAINVHVRTLGGPGARYSLLFRDYLRADDAARAAWGAFKLRLARSAPEIYDYGQIKTPATEVLMRAAARWADDTGWTP